MRILTLIIKQDHLDQIVAGTKKVETRDIRPNNHEKYLAYTDDDVLPRFAKISN